MLHSGVLFKSIVSPDDNLYTVILFQVIESLSLADSKLKLETPVVINALGSNTSLTQIDIRLVKFCSLP